MSKDTLVGYGMVAIIALLTAFITLGVITI
jgi:hypothetical protein